MPFDPAACDMSFRPEATPTLSLSAIGATGVSLKWPPLRVTEVLINWMRYHFADTTRIVLDELADKVWIDTAETPIIIGSLAEYNPEQANNRPAILVARLAQQPAGEKGVDHRRMGGCGPGDAAVIRHMMWSGAHVIHCIGGREGEGELLASEVWSEITGFLNLVAPRICLIRAECNGVAPRTLMEEHKETWTSPIGIAYTYWRSTREYPLDVADLSNVRLTLTRSET